MKLTLQHGCSSLKEGRTETQTGQNIGNRSCYRGHGGVLFNGLLHMAFSAYLLTEPRTSNPGMMALPTMSWALLY